MLAIDTETWPVSEEAPIPRLVSVAAFDGRQSWLLHRRDNWRPLIEHALQHGWIGANAPFDVFTLLQEAPDLFPLVVQAYEAGRIWDVLTCEKMIDTAEGFYRMRGGYDLEAVAGRRAGVQKDSSERWRTGYGELDEVPIHLWPADAREYAESDPAANWYTYVAQTQHPYAAEILRDRPRQARGHLALYAQTIVGVDTDPAAVADLDRRLDARVFQLAMRLRDAGLVRIGGTKKAPRFVKTVKAAQQSLVDYAVWTGQTGKLEYGKKGPSVSEDAIRAVQLPDDHPLRDYQVYGTILNSRTKNMPSLRHPRVRTRYDEFVSTGRSSSSAPDEPMHGTNFQNLPTPRTMLEWNLPPAAEWLAPQGDLEARKSIGFRECLVPPAGCLFVVADWAGLELVPLAQTQLDWFGHSVMADALRQGRDLHRMFACVLLAIGYDAFDKKHPQHKLMRDLAKKWNFGRGGGMGDAKFQIILAKDGVYMDIGQIREYNQEWLRLWAEMPLYFKHVSAMKGADGWITIALPRTGLIRGRCTYAEACNFPFQGTAAAAMKDALWQLWLAGLDPASPLYGCYQAIVVHDENVTVAPKHQAEVALVEQERIMRLVVAGVCPDVPVGIESSIKERYTK